jgi:hypothetical protein
MAINYKLITAVSDASSPDTVFTATAVATHIKSVRIANESGSALTYHLAVYDNSAAVEVPITVPATSLPDDDVDVMTEPLNLQNGDYIKLYSSGAGVKVAITLAENTDTAGATTSDDLAEGTTNLYMTSAERSKLSGIATGAEVNQNAFSNVAVSGQTTVAADLKTDTLTLVAGTNITLTTDAATDSITIAATGSSGNSFETIAVAGQSNVVADSATDTLTMAAAGGVTITTNATTDTVTISSKWLADDNVVLNGSRSIDLNGDDFEIINGASSVASFATSGEVVLNELIASDIQYPTTDGTAGQVIQTNGTGQLSFGSLDTDDVSEGTTNKYFTTARVDTQIDARIAASDLVTSVNAVAPNSTGAVTIDTDDVGEGTTNQYHTATRVNDLIDTWADAAVAFSDDVDAQGAISSLTAFDAKNRAPVRLRESTANGTNFIGLRAPASVAADVTFTVPGADGTAGQVLQTDGSATMSWVTKKVTQVTGKTVATGAWSLVSGYYEASISDSAILSTSIVDVIPDNASASVAATAGVLPRTDSSTGAVKIYATATPASTLTVTLNIFDL